MTSTIIFIVFTYSTVAEINKHKSCEDRHMGRLTRGITISLVQCHICDVSKGHQRDFPFITERFMNKKCHRSGRTA